MLSVRVSRLDPAGMYPTSLIEGQSLCSLTGSDTMLCGRVSLLMNVTWFHALIWTSFGLTPVAVIVIVAADVGESGELHAAATTAAATNGTAARRSTFRSQVPCSWISIAMIDLTS